MYLPPFIACISDWRNHMEICAVVMAAGDSKRMKSAHSKVVHQVAGKPIIKWVSDSLCEAGCIDQVFIVGDKQEEIRNVLGESVAYIFQEQRLGTGHAVMQAAPYKALVMVEALTIGESPGSTIV